jgi:hypothetical protein
MILPKDISAEDSKDLFLSNINASLINSIISESVRSGSNFALFKIIVRSRKPRLRP